MSITEWVIIGSGVSAGLLTLLFYIESRAQRRVLSGVRNWLDTAVDWCIVRWHTLMLYIGSGAARVGLHYLTHRFLRSLASSLDTLRALIMRWQRRNRRIARTVQAVRTESHLTAIADHKHTTALSESEKTDLKQKSLEG